MSDAPTIYDAILWDPMVPVDDEARAIAVRDLKRPSRRRLLGIARVVSLVAVFGIRVLKRVLPFQFSWHRAIDVLCVWFIRRFVSPEAGWLLLRHFVVETNLLRFLAKACGDASVRSPTLRPTTLAQLGDGAVIVHDVNAYAFVVDLGKAKGRDLSARDPRTLDASDLVVPPLDCEPERRRWLNLDIETSLYLMNIPFCLFTTEDEYERAVNSFQLDESFMAALAAVTGDGAFRGWTPLKFPAWISVRRDVPRDLYWHAIVCEYAHTHLRRLCGVEGADADAARVPSSGTPGKKAA